MHRGLSKEDAVQNLSRYGFNELITAAPRKLWHIALEVVKEPMFLLLISCATLYMLVGDYREGIIMLCTILIIISITFYQSQKTERALEALKNLSSPRALVIRDGKEIRIPGREVVPDDIVILNEGDRIPADGIIINSNNLTVDESLLTGESVPVIKNENNEKNNRVFSGTLVVQGRAQIKIEHTGNQTEFGKIGKALSNIEADQTRLQVEMKTLIRRLFIFGAFVCLTIVTLFYFTRGGFIQSLLNGLSAAMAILPEEFPVVLTVFLALGSWRLSKKNVLTRKPSAIETLGSATVLCSDKTGTITQNKMEVSSVYNKQEITGSFKDKLSSEILFYGQKASHSDSIDPMDKAILNIKTGITYNYKFEKEFPLSKDLLAMSRVYSEENKNDSFCVFTKGAPEAIFGMCKLSGEEIKNYESAMQKMAASGLRVIAVASGALTKIPDKQTELNLTFNGLIGLEDPIRPEVPEAINDCNKAGIKVIMITGDYPVTARSIANKAGLNPNGKLLTGEELNTLSDDALKNCIEEVNVFARVVPEQKLRIIRALKANNEIVAMTGDGVNDAPALKAADIGIAMGSKGTDVAREASSLVLLDDNFASIVSAIRLGRKIFDNLQKAMSYIMAIHVPIIGLTLLPAFISDLPLLLMPLHIVFMELIIDPVCSVAFESEQEEKSIMLRPPRNPNEKFFGFNKIFKSVLQGILLFVMVVIVFFLSVNEGHTEKEARAIAFTSLIIGNVFLILSNLSSTRSFVSALFEKNFSLLLLLTASILLLGLINFVPLFASLFKMSNPGFIHFGSALAGGATLLLILEVIKFINAKKFVVRN